MKNFFDLFERLCALMREVGIYLFYGMIAAAILAVCAAAYYVFRLIRIIHKAGKF